MHGGPRIGAGDQQQLRAVPVAAARGRQVGERGERPPAFVAQQPEPGPRLGHESGAAPGAFDAICAEPEEREMVVLDPFEEGAHLFQLLAIDRRRRRLQIRDVPAQRLAHAAPVLDRSPDVVERGAHLRRHRVEHLLLGLAIGLDADHRLDDGSLAGFVDGTDRNDAAVFPAMEPHHGVDHEMARVPAPVQDHAHRVDQEGHVVGDDLDDGMGRLPAVLLDPRVVDPDLRRARRTPPGEVEVRRRGAVEIARLAFGEVVGRDARVIPGDEGQDEVEVLAAHPLASERRDFFHQPDLPCRRLDRHWRPPLASFGRCRPEPPCVSRIRLGPRGVPSSPGPPAGGAAPPPGRVVRRTSRSHAAPASGTTPRPARCRV